MVAGPDSAFPAVAGPVAADAKPSKSARKRENLALQSLGETLVRLAPSELSALPLDEPLREAVADARRMTSRGALRRQRQLIGKLMRTADAAAIRASLAGLAASRQAETGRLHSAEHWRDRICTQGTSAVAEFAAATRHDAATLSRLVEDLAAAGDDHRQRIVRRRIFREVHSALAGTVDEKPVTQ